MNFNTIILLFGSKRIKYMTQIFHYRNKYDIDVLFITDITKNGEKATKGKWEFTLLEKQMEEGTLQLLRFNLLDIQVIQYV